MIIYFLGHAYYRSYPAYVLLWLVLIVLYAAYQMVSMGMQWHKNSLKQVVFTASDQVILKKRQGGSVLGQISTNSYVGKSWIILIFRQARGINSCVLTRESVGGEFAYRKLAALLLSKSPD